MLMIALVIAPHAAVAQAWAYTKPYSTLTDLGQQSRVGPSVAVDSNGLIYLAWAGTNGPQSGQAYLNIAYSTDGVTFSSAMNPLSSIDWSLSNAAPAIAVLNGNIYYAWTGGSNNINIAYASTGTNLSGAFTSHKSLVNIGGSNQRSAGSVALTASNGTLYLAWAGSGNNLINFATSTNGTTWQKYTYSYVSPYSPGLASSPTGAVYLAWASNNQCFYLNVAGPINPLNCSGTLPNGGGTYTYAPVLGMTGPGIAVYGAQLVSSFGALPYTSGNALWLTPVSPGNNAYLAYEVVTPPTLPPTTLGVAGNPAILPTANTNLVYFTEGTEINVASFATLP
jgi:hypothetical protein